MRVTNDQKLLYDLGEGQIFRRELFAPQYSAVDRDLAKLVKYGEIQKIAPGIYYKPRKSLFGSLPPDETKLIYCFLSDENFLLYNYSRYNVLPLGLTQLYKESVVYNRKRHGIFRLAGRSYRFRIPTHDFPKEITPEFLFVDIVNNIDELSEDKESVLKLVKKNVKSFDYEKLQFAIQHYTKTFTKKFFNKILNG